MIAAVPPGARVGTQQEIEPKWGLCGQKGWDDVEVDVLFSSSLPATRMAAWARKVVSAHRWALYSAGSGAGLSPATGETDWGIPVRTGTATVRLTDNIPASVETQSGAAGSPWYLQAQAPPAGTRAGGC